jgi:hypothetical protein
MLCGTGDQEQAFKWLERAVAERDIWLMNLKVDSRVFSNSTLRSIDSVTDILARIPITIPLISPTNTAH